MAGDFTDFNVQDFAKSIISGMSDQIAQANDTNAAAAQVSPTAAKVAAVAVPADSVKIGSYTVKKTTIITGFVVVVGVVAYLHYR